MWHPSLLFCLFLSIPIWDSVKMSHEISKRVEITFSVTSLFFCYSYIKLYLCLDIFLLHFYNKQIIINSSSAFIISTLMGFWAWMNEGSVKFFFLVSWSIFDFILMMIWWIDDGNETQNPLVKNPFSFCYCSMNYSCLH